jgi:pimeloyl-ACP methyl ester carboxylesterase
MPVLAVNGAELYHEVRGAGPAVLLIMGATGDAGHFETLADLLADEFTVVSYDRRGNGRSPRPAGWATTSPAEQADDAAGLLDALGLAPAAVFGSSSGANFALALAIRHPASVRGAILHEPVLTAPAIQSGEAPPPLERFWRNVAGDANWERLAPGLRARMLGSADTFFGIEVGTFEGLLPDDEALAAIAAPVQVLVSEQGRLPGHQAAGRLAERLGVAVIRTPGTHTAYHDRPEELARTLRPFLRPHGSPPRR